MNVFGSYIAAVVAIAIWGATFAGTKELLYEFSALEILLARFILGWATLAIIDLVFAKGRCNKGRCCEDWWLFALMGLTGIAIYQFFENAAIYYTNASNVAILVSFGPIVTVAMAKIFLHERISSARLALGSAVATVGVILTHSSGFKSLEFRPLGDFMVLAAILSWGIYSILSGIAFRKGYAPVEIAKRSFFWGIALLLPVAIWGMSESGYYALDGSFSVTLSMADNIERFANIANWVNIAFLGLLASSTAFVLWNKACRGLGIARSSVASYLTPIVGMLAAWLISNERPTVANLVGAVIILAGVVISEYKSEENT